MQTRLVVKYRHVDGKASVKVTDDHKVSEYGFANDPSLGRPWLDDWPGDRTTTDVLFS